MEQVTVASKKKASPHGYDDGRIKKKVSI